MQVMKPTSSSLWISLAGVSATPRCTLNERTVPPRTSIPCRLEAAARRSMSVRLAVAAMVAAHGRLDETRAVVVAAADERQADEAGVRRVARLRRRPALRRRADVPRDRVADHRAQLLL